MDALGHVALEGDDEVAEKKGRPSAPGEAWVAVRVPEGVKEYAEEQARQEERSVSYVLRRLIGERVDQLKREQKQGYRALEPGEQAMRKTCPHCGDTHLALFDASTGATQCRACGETFFVNTKPRLEREAGQ